MQLPACYVLSSGLILLLLLTMTMLPTVYCYCCYAVQDKATVTVSAAAPLSLRIPCWCNSATVTVGSQQPKTAPACAHFQLDSAPANTPIVIAFNNSIRIYTWHANGNDCLHLLFSSARPSTLDHCKGVCPLLGPLGATNVRISVFPELKS
jgi:hypothetical protein